MKHVVSVKDFKEYIDKNSISFNKKENKLSINTDSEKVYEIVPFDINVFNNNPSTLVVNDNGEIVIIHDSYLRDNITIDNGIFHIVTSSYSVEGYYRQTCIYNKNGLGIFIHNGCEKDSSLFMIKETDYKLVKVYRSVIKGKILASIDDLSKEKDIEILGENTVQISDYVIL